MNKPPIIAKVPRPAANLRRGVVVGALALAAALAVLFFFDPASHAFYPQCMFKRLTGWDCPGCGGLRATHQLLHGHVGAAFALNPLPFLLAPAGLWWLAAQRRGWKIPTWLHRGETLLAFVAALLVFTILRNVR